MMGPGGTRRALQARKMIQPKQRRADILAAQEFQKIKTFVAACRRQWPGAIIVLRPDGAPTGANAPPNPKLAPGASVDD
jgi:hypothetical protein